MTKLAALSKVHAMLAEAGQGLREPSMDRVQQTVLSVELAHLLREAEAARAAVKASAQEIEAIRATTRQRAADIVQLNQDLQKRDAQIAAILSSTSWRLTAPLRSVATRMRASAAPVLLAPPHTTPGAIASPPAGLPAPNPHEPGLQQGTAAAEVRGRARKTILIVADFPPLHDQSAGGLRLRGLIRLMGEAGWTVQFGSYLALGDLPGVLRTVEGRARYETGLQADGVDRFFYGMAAIDEYLQREGALVDWAFLSFPTVAAELLPLVRCRCPTAMVAYDMVDFHSLRMTREAAVREDAELAALARKQQAIELSCVKGSDVTIAVSADEKRALLELAPKASVAVLPCLFDVPDGPVAPLEARRDLLFVGGFWHQPNADAMLWFVAKIWPLVRMNEPDALLRIVGANPGDDILALRETPGVEVLGFVPDLTETFDSHRVFVAPLRFGAGMKGKVAQSLSLGLPVVGTPVAAEGMSLIEGEHILVASEPNLFADHIIRLMRDDYLWEQMSKKGRTHIRKNFATDVVRGQLLSVLNDG